MTPHQSSRWQRALRLVAVLVIGLVATAGLAFLSADAQAGNERSLLQQRADEATTTLATVLPIFQLPIGSAAAVIGESNASGESFERVVGGFVSPDGLIQSATLWIDDGSGPEPLHTVGEASVLSQLTADQIAAQLDTAPADGVTTVDLTEEPERALGFVQAVDEGDARYYVHLEARLPDDPTSFDLTQGAFDDLDYAVYVGERAAPQQLLFASTRDLPIDDGDAEVSTVPFADGQLLVVLTAKGRLGDPLLAQLPWVIAVVGLALTAAFALLTQRMQSAADTAARLAAENAELYAEQHGVAKTLQQSLLPSNLAVHPQISSAHRYEAGVDGIEIGGDWYDAVLVGDRVLITVGDVSGRGLPAATVMATMRLSFRAYATQGDGPAAILERLNSLLDVRVDGHFATILCASIDLRTLQLTAATAGHPPPVILDDGQATLLAMHPGYPVGVQRGLGYEETTVSLSPGALLVAYTDGLFERRGETVDQGLERVRHCVETLGDLALDDVVERITGDLRTWESADDTALLAVKIDGPHPEA